MQSGDFNVYVTVMEVDPLNTNVLGEREEYVEKGDVWGNVSYLETVKDNEAETSRSHDSAFAVARLTLRRNSFPTYSAKDRYIIDEQVFEGVGQPIYPNRELVYLNIRNRDDI